MIRVAKVRSRLLVIDASIARAAGEISMHPTSRGCREFLEAVRDHGHRMVMTVDIEAEWNKHQSRYARTWRLSMMSRRRIERIEIPAHRTLEHRIARAVVDEFLVDIVDKDRRLIEAALIEIKKGEKSERVGSLDDHVRKHLRDHIDRLLEIRSICWINPCTPEEEAVAWLRAGAPAERKRTLGHREESETGR